MLGLLEGVALGIPLLETAQNAHRPLIAIGIGVDVEYVKQRQS
jgi:hypothetical protein